MGDRSIAVFTDGAAKGNPGPGGWGVVIVTPDGLVTELGARNPHATNNQMELTGAIKALTHLDGVAGALSIYTDSTYVIKGITEWISAWRRRGWKTVEGGDVLNRDLWLQLSSLVAERGSQKIDWRYVRGHVGIAGNERVDEIADAFAQGRNVELYAGTLDAYPRQILNVPASTEAPRRAGSSPPRQKPAAAYSYLSVVDGTAMRHATWAECEQRTKGRSKARFKKAASQSDEVAILQSWGFKPTDV